MMSDGASIGNVEGSKPQLEVKDGSPPELVALVKDLNEWKDKVAVESASVVVKPEKVRRGIDQRVALTLAVQKFKRAEEAFEIASRDFNQACSALRTTLGKAERFVTRIDGKLYLVVSDADGNFDVETLEEV